jgi:demethylmenaquinone methyltransferase / 2-methoxy-6-polyprenyl-1,4-benzoquinol methylase
MGTEYRTSRLQRARNEAKFWLLGDVFERGNRFIPGEPHQRLVESIQRIAHLSIPTSKVERALDLCTGTGYTARLLARAFPGAIIHGLDSSHSMLAVGKRVLKKSGIDNVTLVHGDACELPFESGSLDLVTASFGVHELPTRTRERALLEVARVIRPRGLFAAVDLDRPARLGRLMDAYLLLTEPAHAREVLGDGLVDALGSAGLTCVSRTRGAPGIFQIVVASREGTDAASA